MPRREKTPMTKRAQPLLVRRPETRRPDGRAGAAADRPSLPQSLGDRAGPQAEFRLVEPKDATLWLGEDAGAIRTTPRILAMGADMAAARWAVTGEPVVLDASGKSVDGRKRLRACLAFGVPFPALVCTGVGDGASHTLNTLKVRTPATVMTIHGFDRARVMSIATQAIHRFIVDGSPQTEKARPDSGTLSARDRIAIAEEFEDLVASIDATRGKWSTWVSHGNVAALHCLLHRGKKAVAKAFFEGVAAGGLPPDDPRAALRKALDADVEENAGKHRDRDHRRLIGLVIKAWNAHQAGQKMSQVRLNPAEAYPVIQGVRFPALPKPRSVDDLRDAAEVRRAALGMLARKGLSVRPELVTPAIAEKWLDANHKNRPMHPETVEKYARDFAQGAWTLNGTTIKFAFDGTLIDGQHRLTACVLSGVPFTTFVVRGLDPDAFQSIDLGTRTLFQHVLRGMAVPNAIAVAAASRLLWLYERKDLIGRNTPPTTSELLRHFEENADIAEFDAAQYQQGQKLCTPGIWMMVRHLLRRSDPAKADLFMERLSTGLNLQDANDPIHVLRERLIDKKKGYRGRRPLASELELISLMILGWNAFREGKAVRQLAWRVEHGVPEVK